MIDDNDNDNDNENENDNGNGNGNGNVAHMNMFDLTFNSQLLMSSFNRKHPCRDMIVFLYISSMVVVGVVERDVHCEPSLRIWIIIMGVYLVIRCTLYMTCKYLKRRIIIAELSGNHNPYIWSRRLYTFQMRLMELLDVFGVITFCVGNLMVIRAQHCYHEAPISTWCGLALVLLTNGCLLAPFFRKLCTLCAGGESGGQNDGNNSEIPMALRAHLSRSREDLKRAWAQWLETHGSRSFNCTCEGILNEQSYTQNDEGNDIACPICLVEFEFKGCENVQVQSFPCPSRHVFHEECLLDYLYSVSNRDVMPTCPCCRENAGQRRQRSRVGTEEAPIAIVTNSDEDHDNNNDNNNNDNDNDNDEENDKDNNTNVSGNYGDNAIIADRLNSSHTSANVDNENRSKISKNGSHDDDDDDDDDDKNDEVAVDIIEGTAVVATANDRRRNEKDTSDFDLDISTICCDTAAAAAVAESSVSVSIHDYEHEQVQDKDNEEARINV